MKDKKDNKQKRRLLGFGVVSAPLLLTWKQFALVTSVILILTSFTAQAEVSQIGHWQLLDDDTLTPNNESWNVSIGKNGTTAHKLYVNGTAYITGNTIIDGYLLNANLSNYTSSDIYIDDDKLFVNHTGGAGGNIFDQDLNRTSNVNFTNINCSNISIGIGSGNWLWSDANKILNTNAYFNIDKGNTDMILAKPLFRLSANNIGTASGVGMLSSMYAKNSGATYAQYGSVADSYATGNTCKDAYYRISQPVAGTSGTHTKYGIDVGISYGAGDTGGTYKERGLSIDMGGGVTYPSTDTGTIRENYGIYLERDGWALLGFMGGSVESHKTYGIFIDGYADSGDILTCANISENYAVYSTGGDTLFGTGEHCFTGTLNASASTFVLPTVTTGASLTAYEVKGSLLLNETTNLMGTYDGASWYWR